MPEIGSSLREARMRVRLDITEAEADTKIRGKYLRALENEEWDLLPGPTFVKSFLRTYGDYLGLDGRMLVEEFKLRYERAELQPIVPSRGGNRERERGRRSAPSPPGRSRAILVGGLVVALLVGLFLLGRGGGDDKAGTSTGTGSRTTSTGANATTTTREAPSTVRLRIIPTGEVYACLRAGSRTLINGLNLTPGDPTRTFEARRLRLTLGNGDARLVVNGKARDVPASANGIAYEITPSGVRRIAVGDGPAC